MTPADTCRHLLLVWRRFGIWCGRRHHDGTVHRRLCGGGVDRSMCGSGIVSGHTASTSSSHATSNARADYRYAKEKQCPEIYNNGNEQDG